jgi:Fanconi anemia group M protein
MLNKRLIRQLHELKQYPKQLLIVEGIDEQELYNDEAEQGLHPNAIRGMILSILLDFQIPIVFTKDYEDSAKFLVLLKKRQERGPREISLKAKKKALNIKEQQQFIIEGFPGIGPSTAKALLKKFKSIKAIINAKPKQLEKIIKKKKTESLRKIIETKYRA